MQIYSYAICLILLFTFNLISARNTFLDSNQQQQQQFDNSRTYPKQNREFRMRKLSSGLVSKRLPNHPFTNEHFIFNEQERLMPMIRHAKAIVKGDPREFMG